MLRRAAVEENETTAPNGPHEIIVTKLLGAMLLALL